MPGVPGCAWRVAEDAGDVKVKSANRPLGKKIGRAGRSCGVGGYTQAGCSGEDGGEVACSGIHVFIGIWK